MNWYKIAQQRYLWDDDPLLSRANDILPKNNEWQPSGDLSSDLEDAQNPQQVYIVLDAYKNNGIEYEEIDFAGGVKILKVYQSNDIFLVDPEYPKLQNPKEWLSNINDVWSYVDNGNFNKEYWDEIGNGSVVYHGTRKDNLNSILKNGLNPRNETRGIANRSTGASVFTSDNPETPASYYDIVLEINVGQMKADGYMPQVSLEEPIEEAKGYELLAWKIGIQDYFHEVEQGLDAGTVIFYDAIPAKYIRVYE